MLISYVVCSIGRETSEQSELGCFFSATVQYCTVFHARRKILTLLLSCIWPPTDFSDLPVNNHARERAPSFSTTVPDGSSTTVRPSINNCYYSCTVHHVSRSQLIFYSACCLYSGAESECCISTNTKYVLLDVSSWSCDSGFRWLWSVERTNSSILVLIHSSYWNYRKGPYWRSSMIQ